MSGVIGGTRTVFASVTQPLQLFEADAITATAPHISRARRARHAAELALTRAQRAVGPRLRSAADLGIALAELEQHGYIRSKRVARSGFGRPRGPAYEGHPALVRA